MSKISEDAPTDIAEVARLAQLAATPKVVQAASAELIAHDGKVVDARSLLSPSQPRALTVASLTGLVDYVAKNIDALDLGQIACVVETPMQVSLVGKLGERDLRNTYVVAACDGKGFPFGQYQEQQAFLIGLMTQFADTPARAELIAAASKIASGETIDLDDDGVGQTVTLQARAGLKQKGTFQTIHVLQPWRTFREVTQPASPFLLRIQGGKDVPPTLALFECDGGQWRNEARRNVGEWLTKELDEADVQIAVLA